MSNIRVETREVSVVVDNNVIQSELVKYLAVVAAETASPNSDIDTPYFSVQVDDAVIDQAWLTAIATEVIGVSQAAIRIAYNPDGESADYIVLDKEWDGVPLYIPRQKVYTVWESGPKGFKLADLT